MGNDSIEEFYIDALQHWTLDASNPFERCCVD